MGDAPGGALPVDSWGQLTAKRNVWQALNNVLATRRGAGVPNLNMNLATPPWHSLMVSMLILSEALWSNLRLWSMTYTKNPPPTPMKFWQNPYTRTLRSILARNTTALLTPVSHWEGLLMKCNYINILVTWNADIFHSHSQEQHEDSTSAFSIILLLRSPNFTLYSWSNFGFHDIHYSS